MARVVHTPQSLTGPAMTAGKRINFVAADTVNKEQVAFTGREILIAWNSGGTTRTVTIDGKTDPYGGIRHLTAKNVAAGNFKIFGPFDAPAWMQTGRILTFEASHADIRFAVLRLPTTPNTSQGVLDAGGVITAALTRTTITPQRVPGGLATDGIVLALTPADTVLFNRLLISGRDILFAYNDDTGPTYQVETATIVGTITVAGDVSVVVTRAGMTGSPITIPVAVLVGDNATAVATKIRAALNANTNITAVMTVGGAGADVVLTSTVDAADDATFNLAYGNGTTTGLTPDATSTDTTAGAASVSHTMGVDSVADDHGRLGDISEPVGGKSLVAYGNFDYAWMQGNRYLYLDGNHANLQLGAIRY